MSFIKGLFKIIIIFFVVVLIIPIAICGTILIKDANTPSYLDNFDYTNYNEKSAVISELNSMLFTNILGDKKISVSEETLNKVINKQLTNYPTTFNVIGNEEIKLTSIWTKLDNNVLSAYALVNYRNVSTTATLKLSIENTDDGLIIYLKIIKLGKLPVPNAVFSYGLPYLSDYFNLDNQNIEIDLSKLFVKIEKSYIQDLINKNVGSDIILFDTLQFINDKIVISYKLNLLNENAVYIENMMNALKDLIKSDTLTTDITNILDLSNHTQSMFNNDFINVMDMFNQKLDNPSSFTSEELTLLNSLSRNYKALPSYIQQSIVLEVESNISSDVKTDFNESFNSLGFNTNINQLLNGAFSSNY